MSEIYFGKHIEGFRMKIVYPFGRQVGFVPDELNRIDTISEGATEICDYNYIGPFRVNQRIYQKNSANPINLAVTYNNNRWATEYRYTGAKTWQATEIDKPFGKAQGEKGKPKKYDWVQQTIGFAYDFDKEGNKKYEKFLHKNGEGYLFAYDNIYRLTKVKYGVPNVETWAGNFNNAPYADKEVFNMDNVGNRTAVTNGTTTTYQTNDLNQYTQVNGTTLSYDLNGNMTNDGYNSSIVYDYTNHPIRFDNADYLVEMRSDVLGRRIEKKSVVKTTGEITVEKYILDGARVISDVDITGAVYKDYIWGNGIDELLATAKGRSRKFDFYLNNSLGSITHVVNDQAEVQESYKYKVFGTVSIYDKKGEIANKSKEKNRYMFTGREYEPETRLYYYRTRYYSSMTGRFLQRDSRKHVNNSNLYLYVNNGPVVATDPYGLDLINSEVLKIDKNYALVSEDINNPEHSDDYNTLSLYFSVKERREEGFLRSYNFAFEVYTDKDKSAEYGRFDLMQLMIVNTYSCDYGYVAAGVGGAAVSYFGTEGAQNWIHRIVDSKQVDLEPYPGISFNPVFSADFGYFLYKQDSCSIDMVLNTEFILGLKSEEEIGISGTWNPFSDMHIIGTYGYRFVQTYPGGAFDTLYPGEMKNRPTFGLGVTWWKIMLGYEVNTHGFGRGNIIGGMNWEF